MLHSARWFMKLILYLILTNIVSSISIQFPPTYSIIDTADELFQNTKSSEEHEIPQVSRRGYAGDDFYQKASKSIPRMGRRSEPNSSTCFCASQDTDDMRQNDETLSESTNGESLYEDTRRKRLNFEPRDTSGWPWYSDRVPNLELKRTEVNDPCYYSPKAKSHIASNEICNEDMICCPILNDSSLFKRILSSRISKQSTTSAPDYKSNQFTNM